jgi:tRNA pseudouridine38-40 synthase
VSQRFFITLSYLGSRYCGWQAQPNAPSVQATLEAALGTLLRGHIGVTGCGRTDTGVHARYYTAHFDAEGDLPPNFLIRLNGLLPQDIAVHTVAPVHADAHARFDAFERSYEYHIALRKDPFAQETSWFYPHFSRLDLEKMRAFADLLPTFDRFFPFCKTHSGVDSYACTIKSARWEHRPEAHRLIFHITANRFLRGMVRLVVGAGISVGNGQLALGDVREALEEQKPLRKSWSVPPEGLFLTEVRY